MISGTARVDENLLIAVDRVVGRVVEFAPAALVLRPVEHRLACVRRQFPAGSVVPRVADHLPQFGVRNGHIGIVAVEQRTGRIEQHPGLERQRRPLHDTPQIAAFVTVRQMAGRLLALPDEELDGLRIGAARNLVLADLLRGFGRENFGDDGYSAQPLPKVEVHQRPQETGLGFHFIPLRIRKRGAVHVLQEDIGIADADVNISRIELAHLNVGSIPRSGIDETDDVGPLGLALQFVGSGRHQSAVGAVVLEAIIARMPVIGKFIDRAGVVNVPKELLRAHLRGEDAVDVDFAADRFFQKVLAREAQRHEPAHHQGCNQFVFHGCNR